jgi:hypothetical protein
VEATHAGLGVTALADVGAGGAGSDEPTIEELMGILHGKQKILADEQRAVRESKKAIAEMEAEIVRRCAAEQEARRKPLADAGAIVNDSQLTLGLVMWAKAKPGEHGVTLWLQEVQA